MKNIRKKTLENIVEERSDTLTMHKVKIKTADAGARFLNYIIDTMVVMSGLGILIAFMLLALPSSLSFLIVPVILFSFPLYYALTEHYLQQTVGKMVTGSVVIDKYAEGPDLGTCVQRTFLRIVPFERWSFLGTPCRGWHDEWSHTWVVSKEEAKRLKEIVDRHNGGSAI